MESLDYYEEIARAASSRMGQPVVNHKRMAGCEYGETLDACMETGLGENGFDCSGLVIRSLCDVQGIPVSVWPKPLRHVRDMFVPGTRETDVTQLRKGYLAVYGRFYDLEDGMTRLSPAHIGIVVHPDVQHDAVRMIHAAYERVSNGRAPLHATHERLMGIIDPAVLASRALGQTVAA